MKCGIDRDGERFDAEEPVRDARSVEQVDEQIREAAEERGAERDVLERPVPAAH